MSKDVIKGLDMPDVSPCTHVSVSEYSEWDSYGNFMPNPVHGKEVNWKNADSGFLPANTVKMINDSDTVVDGLISVIQLSIKKYHDEVNPRVNYTQREVFGFIQSIVSSFGMGAKAERLAEKTLESDGIDIFPQISKDESNGIDIRSSEFLFQVKLADYPRSDWSTPGSNPDIESDKQREKELIWVNYDGNVHILDKNSNEHLLENRYTKLE